MSDLSKYEPHNILHTLIEKMITELEVSAPKQKALMDNGNTFAAGVWTDQIETLRYLRWILRMADEELGDTDYDENRTG